MPCTQGQRQASCRFDGIQNHNVQCPNHTGRRVHDSLRTSQLHQQWECPTRAHSWTLRNRTVLPIPRPRQIKTRTSNMGFTLRLLHNCKDCRGKDSYIELLLNLGPSALMSWGNLYLHTLTCGPDYPKHMFLPYDEHLHVLEASELKSHCQWCFWERKCL